MLRNKSIPLYYQVETILRKKIQSGDFTLGIPLPGEEALAAEFEVSRITIRQAMASLEQSGLILRQRGKGTFLTEKALSLELPSYTGSIENLILMGKRTSTEILNQEWVQATQLIRERLNVGEKDQILRIEKIRRMDDSPFSYVVNYLPPAIGKKLPKDLLQSKPLLVILEDELGIRAMEAEQSVQATIADTEMAALLDIRIGDPLLKAERIVYDISNNPVEYVSVLYRADKYTFTVKLKRKRTKEFADWRIS